MDVLGMFIMAQTPRMALVPEQIITRVSADAAASAQTRLVTAAGTWLRVSARL